MYDHVQNVFHYAPESNLKSIQIECLYLFLQVNAKAILSLYPPAKVQVKFRSLVRLVKEGIIVLEDAHRNRHTRTCYQHPINRINVQQ